MSPLVGGLDVSVVSVEVLDLEGGGGPLRFPSAGFPLDNVAGSWRTCCSLVWAGRRTFAVAWDLLVPCAGYPSSVLACRLVGLRVHVRVVRLRIPGRFWSCTRSLVWVAFRVWRGWPCIRCTCPISRIPLDVTPFTQILVNYSIFVISRNIFIIFQIPIKECLFVTRISFSELSSSCVLVWNSTDSVRVRWVRLGDPILGVAFFLSDVA